MNETLSIDLFHRVVVVVHERFADMVLGDVVVVVRFVLDRRRGGRVELLDEDLDDLGELVEVEYVERDAGDDACQSGVFTKAKNIAQLGTMVSMRKTA